MTDSDAQPPVDPAAGLPQAAQPQPSQPAQPPYTAPQSDTSSASTAQQPSAQQPYTQQPAAPQQPYAAAEAAPLTAAQDRQYAMWAHLGGAISFLAFFTGWLAILAIVPALVIYLVFGKRGTLTKQESKEALNFQITMVAAMIVWAIIAAIVTAALLFSLNLAVWTTIILILALIGWALVVLDVVFSIVGAVRVNGGGSYRYPFALRFIK
ncbi:MAG: DUF4870 domain-containing protein [Microbacteriaceae bacterium]|nr:MAG: DUF4870 domain-containing protein [Microbacteriaceae bacterium]